MKIIAIALLISASFLSACSNDADVASKNISTAADNFQVARRIVFYNTWTNTYMLEVDGLCSLGNADHSGELSVTCKTPDGYKKHFLGLSNNVTYFVEQLDSAAVSANRYRVIFKPESIVPDIQVR